VGVIGLCLLKEDAVRIDMFSGVAREQGVCDAVAQVNLATRWDELIQDHVS